MVKSLVLLLALGSAGAAIAAAPGDKPVETITRTGQWHASYDRDSCNLVAPMGEGKGGAAVKFTRYQPGERFDLAVFGSRFDAMDVRVEGTADFGLSPQPIATDALSGNAGKFPALFFGSMRLDGWNGGRNADGPQITPEQEARVTGVTLAMRGSKPLRLEFGSLAGPMAEMRKCMDDLVKSWGYDPAQQQAAMRSPSAINPAREWLKSNDYPKTAMWLGHNGIVQFRLDVDAEGKVAGCYVLSRTSPDDFADITCRNVAKRAKLSPALDAQGRPMRSFWIGKVRWMASSR